MEAVADSYSDMPVGDAGQMREAMASFRKILNSKSTGKKDGKRLTMRALHNAKQEFYRANKGNPAAQRVYDMTTQWLSEIDPDYAKLSRTYASAIHDEKAFNTGYKYFTGKQQTSDDVQAVMSRLGTYSELTAFAQGARRKLMEDLKGKSPQAVSKYLFEQSYKVDMLKAALGEERAHKLLGAVMAEVAGETTLRSLNAGKAAAANSDQAPQITKQLADAAIAMLSPGRSPGRVRAVTNTLLPRDAQSPTTAANIIGEYATAPLESHSQLFRQLNDLAKFGKPTGKNRTATMTGGFAGATQAEAQNEIQRYLEQNQ